MADQHSVVILLASCFAAFIVVDRITIDCFAKRPNLSLRDLNQIVQTTYHCLHQTRAPLHCQLPPDPHDVVHCFERSTLLAFDCCSAGFDRSQGVQGGLPPYDMAARRNANV